MRRNAYKIVQNNIFWKILNAFRATIDVLNVQENCEINVNPVYLDFFQKVYKTAVCVLPNVKKVISEMDWEFAKFAHMNVKRVLKVKINAILVFKIKFYFQIILLVQVIKIFF